MHSTGLHVLGFKPLTSLKDYHQLREPTFVYPDEKRMPGSTSAFIALHGEVLRLALLMIRFLHTLPLAEGCQRCRQGSRCMLACTVLSPQILQLKHA